MYLFQNEDERDTHLACLIAVAQADGNILETERQYISYIRTLYGRDLASVEKQAEEDLQSLLSALI